jgi:hypothetical protein
VRAAFGSFGRPGEENVRNARMLGGFGGDGYGNYGDDYADRARFGGYRPRQHGMAGVTGYGERPGDDSSAEEQRLQRLERTYSLVNEQRDHSNYGVGPGNTRFGNDATASRGEVRRDDHTGRGPRNYQRSADRIREDICERLSDDALLDASEIEVKVETRDVTLEGSVRNRAEKRRAEDLAESVPGVGHVQNNLRVGQHQAGSATGSEVGDSGDATGNPGIGTAGTTGGSPPDGRKTGEEIGRRQRQPT